MSFYEELDMIDMEIDYELEWEENARRELEKLNEELMLKTVVKECIKMLESK